MHNIVKVRFLFSPHSVSKITEHYLKIFHEVGKWGNKISELRVSRFTGGHRINGSTSVKIYKHEVQLVVKYPIRNALRDHVHVLKDKSCIKCQVFMFNCMPW